MKYETVDGSQIDQIMEGHEPDPPDGWQDGDNEPDAHKDTDDVKDAENRTIIGGPAEQV
jgi:cell division protease FtsH